MRRVDWPLTLNREASSRIAAECRMLLISRRAPAARVQFWQWQLPHSPDLSALMTPLLDCLAVEVAPKFLIGFGPATFCGVKDEVPNV
jgi:hypothetical protein